MKVFSILLFLGLGTAGFLAFYNADLRDSDPADGRLRIAGIVEANEIIVSAKIDGRLDELRVREGSRVEKGQVLAVLDRAETEAELQNHLARVEELKARVTQYEHQVQLERKRLRTQEALALAELQTARSSREETIAELEQAEKEAERNLDLLEGGAISKQEYERLKTAAVAATARLQALNDQVKVRQAQLDLVRANEGQVQLAVQEVVQARLQIDRATADLEQVRIRLGYSQVKAPLSGVVSLRVAREGEVIRAGSPIVTIMDLDDIWVRADVEETYISRVALDQTLILELPAGKRLEGQVSFVSAESRFATQRDVNRNRRDIRTFGIHIKAPNSDRRLHPGMTAWVFLPESTP